ncbi:hypothetical protein [Corallococcus macrosporus]|uniref:hypothetical protein n=1 Tax=Corallococcus macrosporus TaxID=35 RepID=UPI000BB3C005|nr:hypothetical protein [Corallococcus macrosporus]
MTPRTASPRAGWWPSWTASAAAPGWRLLALLARLASHGRVDRPLERRQAAQAPCVLEALGAVR